MVEDYKAYTNLMWMAHEQYHMVLALIYSMPAL